jgi:hypothetical protein
VKIQVGPVGDVKILGKERVIEETMRCDRGNTIFQCNIQQNEMEFKTQATRVSGRDKINSQVSISEKEWGS